MAWLRRASATTNAMSSTAAAAKQAITEVAVKLVRPDSMSA